MLGNKLLNIPYLEQQERNIQPISSQEHRDAIPPMFSREINWSEGFPNMVLSTEYSEAVNARYTFQPLWVSAITERQRSKLRNRNNDLTSALQVLLI